MYIAMNRFRVAPGFAEAFVTMWRERDSRLAEVPGFRQFHLLQGAPVEGVTTFVSHSAWDSREVFTAWTESDHFRRAHARAKAPEGMYLGPPQFEGYDVVI
jgi:heme-degrading monooxygenase HmoA